MNAVHGAVHGAGAHQLQAPQAATQRSQQAPPVAQKQSEESPQALQLDQENGKGGVVDTLA
jgi:hypothetical protein